MKKLAAALFGLWGTVGAAQADSQIDNWSISGWQGGAYVSDNNGETYCALWDDYGQGTFIWIGRDSTGIYMNITDPGDFYFNPGETFWTSVRFDTLAAANFEAYVSAVDTINIDFGYSDNLIYGLRRAVWLYLDDWGYSYTLHGTDAAVGLLEECYWTYN